MSVRTKKPHTNNMLLYVSCPPNRAKEVTDFLERHDCQVNDDIDAKNVFPDRSPGTLLAGARYREDLTQVQLSQLSGIPRRHISEMENGKRPIGKVSAKRLADVLKIDYRTFL